MDGGFLCLSLMENKQMLCALGSGCQKAGENWGRERWKLGRGKEVVDKGYERGR